MKKTMRAVCLGLFLTVFLTPCYAHHMALVVNKSNNIENLSSLHLAKIFKLETKKWADGSNVVLVLHKSSKDELETLARLNKKTPDEMRSILDAHKDEIRRVDTDAEVIDAVTAIPGAVGFVYERSINDRIRVVKIDGRLPLEAGYLPH